MDFLFVLHNIHSQLAKSKLHDHPAFLAREFMCAPNLVVDLLLWSLVTGQLPNTKCIYKLAVHSYSIQKVGEVNLCMGVRGIFIFCELGKLINQARNIKSLVNIHQD